MDRWRAAVLAGAHVRHVRLVLAAAAQALGRERVEAQEHRGRELGPARIGR